MQEFGYFCVLLDCHFSLGDLDEIGAEFVLIPVYRILQILNQLELFVGIAMQQRNCLDKIPLGLLGHGVDGQAALLDGERGMLDKAFFKPHGLRLDLLLLRLVAHQEVDGLFDLLCKRQQRDDLDETEHRIDKRNGYAGHDTVGKREADQRVKRIINRRKEDHARDLGDQINHGRPFAVDRRADGGQQHRHGRADGNAHDDGKRYGKINDAGRRERLQNADCGRRGLQYAGKQRTEEDAEERIGEGRQDTDKGRVLAQRRNGGGHCGHTEHQDREAHQDIADVLFGRVLCRHTQNDADDRDHARERRRGEQVEPASGRADVGKTDDPARDGRTEDRAQHDGNGLPHLHHTRVDKADDHDRCGGRGLDHRCYAGAQQKALDGIAGQPVQNQLQFIARDLLQSVPHQGHAEQKQRDAAKQRDHIRNTHA